MERPRRRLFTYLAAFSLFLCCATLLFAIGGTWFDQQVTLNTSPARRYDLGLISGTIRFRSVYDSTLPGATRFRLEGWSARRSIGYGGLPRLYLGFAARTLHLFNGDTSLVGLYPPVAAYLICMPPWFVILIFAVPPLIWLKRKRREDGADRGVPCEACGYDLRATPDHCPECGRIPKISI
jgi:hypothetical protein